MKNDRIRSIISESIRVKEALLSDQILVGQIAEAAEVCIDAYRSGGKVLFCGNGGSAADAQHIAAELSGRFRLERDPLFAEALHVNTSFLTAASNDYSFEEAYARLVQAMGRSGDVLVAISTSGNSPNIIRAIEAGKRQSMKVVGLTGSGGGRMDGLCDITIRVPSTDTARIQEAHILIGHIWCEDIEQNLFNQE